MTKRAPPRPLDADLSELPPEERWRVWMGRVEAVVFAAAQPVPRSVLASVVGAGCNLDLLIADIRAELRARPYDLVPVAGGWQHRTRPGFADAIRAAGTAADPVELSSEDVAVLMTVAYLQPLTRAELSAVLGKTVSRDTIGRLRAADLVAPGPRSPRPGAPYTFVTTPAFLVRWGLQSLRDLPDMERLADAGLLSKANVVARLGLPDPGGGDG